MHLPTLPTLLTTLTTLTLTLLTPHPTLAQTTPETPTPTPTPTPPHPPPKASIKDVYSVQYCDFRWNVSYGDWDHFASDDENSVIRASVGKIGVFASVEDCLDGFRDLVEGCWGVGVGGLGW
ncbi:hypothetical protein BO70DRAFT_351342 [Aspergillus heteromorphus CBS 117.55]|uniref:Ecp2 effector protein domain-containing protein n=1 Tax=Aspergillus heteromorphus CBS 117.55 TaxID=1448321 RepID=A0A317WJY2_9EURO|nr:uncharacterized protein BO70DRAFT_351342 [Aspergillus heteromorphus CBS 117.55]PWY86756.1 hypothetical protein BO70DRAFT_351342 [Aspergillus heteromorphus CBS 117.55]